MAETTPKSYSADPTLYLYTSLTAGSSHIITATSRLETILKANKIPFRALDVATDEKARMLWGRRSKGKKLPGLVKFGSIVGDLEQIEEWNEYGELKQQIGVTPTTAPTPTASATSTPSKPPAVPIPLPGGASEVSSDKPAPSPPSKETSREVEPSPTSSSKKEETPLTMAMRQAGAEAAKKAGEKKASISKGPATPKILDTEDVRIPVIETTMARSVQDPGTSPTVTAAKVPGKLAEEGAKRTSVDKIADEGAKRKITDDLSDQEGTNEDGNEHGHEHESLSKEAKMVEARRDSSITKMKSPLSEQSTARSITGPGTADLEARPEHHSRSSTSSASNSEEIEEVEKGKAMLQEPKETAEPRRVNDVTMTEVAASNEGESAAMKGVMPQDGDAKGATEAGTSVGD